MRVLCVLIDYLRWGFPNNKINCIGTRYWQSGRSKDFHSFEPPPLETIPALVGYLNFGEFPIPRIQWFGVGVSLVLFYPIVLYHKGFVTKPMSPVTLMSEISKTFTITKSSHSHVASWTCFVTQVGTVTIRTDWIYETKNDKNEDLFKRKVSNNLLV